MRHLNGGVTVCNDYTATGHFPELGLRSFSGKFTPPSNITFSERGTVHFTLLITITDPTFNVSNQNWTMQMIAFDSGKFFIK